MKQRPRQPVCLGQVNNGNRCQEAYETTSYEASRRAGQLRKLGYDVRIRPRVTPLGTVKLTIIHIRPGTNADICDLPPVEHMNWPVR